MNLTPPAGVVMNRGVVREQSHGWIEVDRALAETERRPERSDSQPARLLASERGGVSNVARRLPMEFEDWMLERR